jgi:UPF0271 protein
MKKIFVLDSSALLSFQQIITPFLEQENSQEDVTFITTKDILAELKDSITKLRLESLISSGKMIVKDVELSSAQFIDRKSKEIGNFDRLSNQDRSIIALCLQEKNKTLESEFILLTDDFEIQNTAKILKMRFQSIKTRGIKYSAHFKKICQACGEKLQEDEKSCPECGSTKIITKKLPFRNKRMNHTNNKSNLS